MSRNVAKGPGGISKTRTPLWFEKFHWFITSENCLVISARDASQADLLVRRYIAPRDAFVHADLPGAPVTVVKAPPTRDGGGGGGGGVSGGGGGVGWCGGVPPLSLAQAGAACLCRRLGACLFTQQHVFAQLKGLTEGNTCCLFIGGERLETVDE